MRKSTGCNDNHNLVFEMILWFGNQ